MASPTQAPSSSGDRHRGCAGLTGERVPWIGEDEGILGSCSSWGFSSSLATARMQEVVVVGYVTDLIKWLSWLKSAGVYLWESWGTECVKNEAIFMKNLFLFFFFFPKLEEFSILTFVSISKIKKKYLVHTWVALCGLLQRAWPWPATVWVEFHACQTWGYQDLFILSIWWLFVVVGFCHELKYSPPREAVMC